MSITAIHRSLKQEIRTFNSYTELDGQVNTPSIQRELMDNHVQSLVDHIIRRAAQGLEPVFGALDLVKFDGIYFVIDGQHRLAALQRALTVHRVTTRFFCVIYHVKNRDEMAEIFQTRNKGLRVPDFILHLEGRKQPLLKQIQEYVQMISLFDHRLKNRPNINIPLFMDHLLQSKMLNLIETLADFKDIFEQINLANQQKYANITTRKKHDISDAMYQKCTQTGIYIGLDKSTPWFDEGYDITPFQEMLKAKQLPPNYHASLSVPGVNLTSQSRNSSSMGSSASANNRSEDHDMVGSLYPSIKRETV